ncbi:MAG: dethiobiotin synthase [Deltaproteobacteria bacterium]|nr:dethiobiotin synthase [Deltaproteobacteria bacterium]
MKPIFIAGIGTDVGKTVVSAVIVEALECDYWKPIQAGELDRTDSDVVRGLVSNNSTVIHPEAFRLTKPASPNIAAAEDGVIIELDALSLPKTSSNLVIEGAGGLLVPINDSELVIDLAQHFNAAVILVSRNYLGSINHTLLSIEAIRARMLPFLGIVFCGAPSEGIERTILTYSDAKRIFSIPEVDNVDSRAIKAVAEEIKGTLSGVLGESC